MLWFNSDRNRFFLIPQGQELPSGDFLLHRGINYQISVDSNSIEPFEITREQAKTWLDSQWDEVVDEAKRSASELFQKWSTPPTEVSTSFDAETKEKLAKVLAQRLRKPD
jgi:hypothetical protein